jgi:hypothetical protein
MSLLTVIKSNLPVTETSVYTGIIPTDSPNKTLGLFLTGSYGEIVTSSGKPVTIRKSTFQIIVRDSSYSSGITRAEALFTLFSHHGIDDSGLNYYITSKSDIISLGKDAVNNSEFSLNFDVRIS